MFSLFLERGLSGTQHHPQPPRCCSTHAGPNPDEAFPLPAAACIFQHYCGRLEDTQEGSWITVRISAAASEEVRVNLALCVPGPTPLVRV